jgi:hypothetical protein
LLIKVNDDFDITLSYIDTPRRDIVAEIKLFGKLHTPTYVVVVGEPTPEVLQGTPISSLIQAV